MSIEGWQHVVKDKTFEDFLNAPETFKFEDRNWILELGWEQYDLSASEKSSEYGSDEKSRKKTK